jgi:hypothetical protein
LRERRSLPEDARLRRLRAFFKQMPFSKDRVAQKTTRIPSIISRYPFRERNSRRVFHNFPDRLGALFRAPSTSVDLTGALATPMLNPKRPTRVSRNRPLFSP